jgi:hypothetical protein
MAGGAVVDDERQTVVRQEVFDKCQGLGGSTTWMI